MKKTYTVAEIDALRQACEDRVHYGTTYLDIQGVLGRRGWHSTIGRSGNAQERTVAVEEMVRTYMLAGITAEDIIEADKPKSAL